MDLKPSKFSWWRIDPSLENFSLVVSEFSLERIEERKV
jgi:hypothetical protein